MHPSSGRCSCGDLERHQFMLLEPWHVIVLTQVEVVVLGVTEEDQGANNVDESCDRSVSPGQFAGSGYWSMSYA